MIAINGDAKPDIIIGPMNDRGTTPGNSWWSYYHRTRICYKRLVTCLSFFLTNLWICFYTNAVNYLIFFLAMFLATNYHSMLLMSIYNFKNFVNILSL